MYVNHFFVLIFVFSFLQACSPENEICEAVDYVTLDDSRDSCSVIPSVGNSVSVMDDGTIRTIVSNNIPSHKTGTFRNASVQAQNHHYEIDVNPTAANSITYLLGSNGPKYRFGVTLNGIRIDPLAAEPWENTETGAFNYDYNLEALHVRLGLDCNEAHVQGDGTYHYHGEFPDYANELGVDGSAMIQIGWAADGYPIYYKYAYVVADDANSGMEELHSSYQLKTVDRGGDGISAPCGYPNGIYSSDYVYVAGLGDLDACNGRIGVTPEFPNGTYYYMITTEFPKIPRCFYGSPSIDFRI